MSAEHEQAQARIDVLMAISGFLLLALIGQQLIETALVIDIGLTLLLALAIIATVIRASEKAGLL